MRDRIALADSRRTASQAENRDDLVFDAIPTPIVVLDRKGTIRRVNRAWIEFASGAAIPQSESSLGASFQNAFRRAAKDSQLIQEVWTGIRSVLSERFDQFEFEYQSTHADRWYRFSATPFSNGNNSGAILMQVDVTAHRRTEVLMREFSDLGNKLSSATTAQEAARIILATADRLFGWDCAYLHLYSPETNRLRPILTIDIIDGKKVDVSSDYLPERPSARTMAIIRKGGRLILRKKGNVGSLGFGFFGDTARPSQSIMVVPIQNGKRVSAVLSIDSYTPFAYNRSDLAALQALANHCGGALERIWAQEALRESEEKLRALAARLHNAREEESLRIAREIHDELGQAMTGLKMDLVWLGKRVANATSDLSTMALLERIKGMAQITDDTIKSVRRISSDLRPGILDDLGLVAAIEWLARDFATRSGLRCEVIAPKKRTMPDQARATVVFRIFQEILTNIARHAQATHVRIELRITARKVVLDVRDNGVGISPKAAAGNSLGIIGMRERALLFGGVVSIETIKPSGTAVIVEIPWAKPSHSL